MKKKNSVSAKDKKDWINFTKKMDNILVKEDDFFQENQEKNKTRRLDLHGYSLEDANRVVKKFITESFDSNYSISPFYNIAGKRNGSFWISL